MEDLKIGDKVLTTDENGRIVVSDIVMFLHRNINSTSVQHLKLTVGIGKTITLTPLHLIQVAANNEYVFARDVRVGDQVNENNMESAICSALCSLGDNQKNRNMRSVRSC